MNQQIRLGLRWLQEHYQQSGLLAPPAVLTPASVSVSVPHSVSRLSCEPLGIAETVYALIVPDVVAVVEVMAKVYMADASVAPT